MMRAILLARAMATTLKGRLAKSLAIHAGALGLPFIRRRTEVAPNTRSERNLGLPIFDIRPSRSLPPLEWGFGVRPSQPAKCRPDVKPPGSETSALMDAAMIAPTPGIVTRRRMSSSCFAPSTMSRPSSPIFWARLSI